MNDSDEATLNSIDCEKEDINISYKSLIFIILSLGIPVFLILLHIFNFYLFKFQLPFEFGNSIALLSVGAAITAIIYSNHKNEQRNKEIICENRRQFFLQQKHDINERNRPKREKALFKLSNKIRKQMIENESEIFKLFYKERFSRYNFLIDHSQIDYILSNYYSEYDEYGEKNLEFYIYYIMIYGKKFDEIFRNILNIENGNSPENYIYLTEDLKIFLKWWSYNFSRVYIAYAGKNTKKDSEILQFSMKKNNHVHRGLLNSFKILYKELIVIFAVIYKQTVSNIIENQSNYSEEDILVLFDDENVTVETILSTIFSEDYEEKRDKYNIKTKESEIRKILDNFIINYKKIDPRNNTK